MPSNGARLDERLATMKRELDRIAAETHDVLVVGGGIHGAAAVWEAAQRGLRAALVEAADFGSGVSWNSLKTVHGGLRHLQRADLAGLRESSRERATLLRIAPRLVRPLPFLVPTYGHGAKGREALWLGLLANHVLTLDRNQGLPVEQRLPRSRMLARDEVLERVAGLRGDGLTGGALWYDAQVRSSERLLIGLLHAAAGAGARLANYAAVTGLRRDGARITGAVIEDAEGGGRCQVSARVVINAAGPALDSLLGMAGIARAPTPLLSAYNLVLRRPVGPDCAIGAECDGRFLFLVPWREQAMLGTAYEPANAPEAEVVTRFLADAQRAFAWADLSRQDVALVHRGLVPGRGGAHGLWTRSRLLDHEADDGTPGLISLLGVKFTTARALAQQAIDRICRRLGRGAPSGTSTTPLLAAAELDGSLEARARLAAREEMALHLPDALLRRLDLAGAGPPAGADVDAVLRGMATELAWSEARQRQERQALAAVQWAAAAGAQAAS